MTTTLIALSGGLDSGVLAHDLLVHGGRVGAARFTYNTKHNPHEITAGDALVTWLTRYPGFDGSWQVNLFDALNAATGASNLNPAAALPEGHYEEENMRGTVVPGRNLIFGAVLASMAEAKGYKQIALGVHAGDHFIYPDCRPPFIRSFASTVFNSTEGKVEVLAPFLHATKKAIVSIGIKNSFPFHLTRTCYSNHPTACGKCGSCQERLEAFKENGLEDPLPYQTRELLPKSK